jgi:hypothetical protein
VDVILWQVFSSEVVETGKQMMMCGVCSQGKLRALPTRFKKPPHHQSSRHAGAHRIFRSVV